MKTYDLLDGCTYRNIDGDRELMANFIATIIEEIRYVDGVNTETYLVIKGIGPKTANDKEKTYPETKVSATNFGSMNWVMSTWGVGAVIQPGSSIKDDLRAAIQLNSQPKLTIVYKHTGWAEIDGQRQYLHNKGAIKATGNDPSVQISLPQELKNYAIESGDKKQTMAAIKASIALTDLAPKSIGWPMLAATFAPLFCDCDYAMHITGRTGTFKSEFASLFQSHYGPKMDSRHLPGSWSSTANALEAQAYYAKNAPFVIDDFIPTGTSWQIRAYQTNADKIMRSQGNQSGRARLTDTSNLQQAMYPRGIILSTGEDTPEGHSVRARMMIMELSPGDIDPKKLTEAQKNRPIYQYTTAALIRYLCANKVEIHDLASQIRDQNLGTGHTRTPAMLGHLCASILTFLEWSQKMGAIKADEKTRLSKEAVDSIIETARDQNSFLEQSDPCDIILAAIRQTFATGLGHIRTPAGGIPKGAAQLGWTIQQDNQSEVPLYKSLGPCIGWINWNDGELHLEANVGFNVIRKVAGNEISLTKQTLMKRMREAGILTRIDEARQRNTVRITAERHPRQCLAISIPKVLETMEIPNERRDPYNGGVDDNPIGDDIGDAWEG